MEVIRPAIDILKNEDSEPHLGCSRFGGAPDLPVGSEWPTYNMKPYRFLGQINFSEITSAETDLPKSGLLSLFVMDDFEEEYDLETWEEGYIHAIFTPDTTNLETIVSPNSIVGKSTVIEFSPTIDIPYDEYQVKNWPFTEEENDIYSEIRESLHKSSDYLLGYPSHCTLAYDPTPGTEWISLLTISSDDDLEWYWHDGDKLMIFIKWEHLKNLDFSSLKADAG
nr:YwqG family protein [Clostridium lundense]